MSKLILVFIFTLLFISNGFSQEDQIYTVRGKNLINDENVVGELFDVDFNGTVTASIWDPQFNSKIEVIGVWTGKGKAILVSEYPPLAYEVEVYIE